MTEKTKTDAAPAEDKAPQRHPHGTVVRLPDHGGRHALVVGYTDDGYPLVLDLPGEPREHQLDIEPV